MSISFLANPVPGPELHGTRFWVAYFTLAAFPTYPSEACWQQLSLLLTLPRALLSLPVLYSHGASVSECFCSSCRSEGKRATPAPRKFISCGGSESRSSVAVHFHRPHLANSSLIVPENKPILLYFQERPWSGTMRTAPTGPCVRIFGPQLMELVGKD